MKLVNPYKLGNRSKLALLLGVSAAELRRFSAAGDELYQEFDIPKKSGKGVRHVENPSRPLKLLQARLARVLSRIEPPDFLFCPVKGRSYVSNAAAHLGNRVVQTLDIRKFFPSTPQQRVFWFFHKIMRCEKDIAGLLARLACYKGHLPTGSPLSPTLAYFSYYDLWERIAGFCRERGHTLTVYVDDVTISGSQVPRSDIWQVKRMIHGVDLRYHKEKTSVDRPVEITGVIKGDTALSSPFRQHKKMRDTRKLLAQASDHERRALMGRMAGLRRQMQKIDAQNQALDPACFP